MWLKMSDPLFQCDICDNPVNEEQAYRTFEEYNSVICSKCVDEMKENEKKRAVYNKICNE